MKINILGAQGGVTSSSSATSILINDNLLLDAGCVASALSIEDQNKIDTIFISHSHLDHVKDLAFLCDNCFGMREKPFKVYASMQTIEAIKNHLFNETIWPDFSCLPTKENPIIEFIKIKENDVVKTGDMSVRACSVNHIKGSLGFIVQDLASSCVFTFDTCATEKIWEMAKEYSNLKAIFSEVSFPDNLQSIADASFHHTPSSFTKEITKMPKEAVIYVLHLKPALYKELIEQIQALDIKRINIIKTDKQIVEI